jgi:nitric oxide reductase subunit B
MTPRRLSILLAVVFVLSFLVLGQQGQQIATHAPPLPSQVLTEDGAPLFTTGQISRGQNVWQALGGQELGSVWGHGAYVAPDWTADFLHREATGLLDLWARAEGGQAFDALDAERQAALKARLAQQLRRNTYQPAKDAVVVSAERAQVDRSLAAHYASVFSKGRAAYAIPQGALTDPAQLSDLAAFFWWTSWASVTNRPGDTVSYTQNWPHEPLVGNVATPGATLWSIVSVVLLIAAIGALVWFLSGHEEEKAPKLPAFDPLAGPALTPSQKASLKFFGVAIALFLVQICLGGVTAHYGVEGDGFFGVPLSRWLPYAVTRSWHTQLGIFWIATTWLATGLFVGPAIGGKEPRFQRLLVNVLFVCLVVIVVGALAGQWASIEHHLRGDASWWFGHQGYEYVDLGRFWQLFLFVGLFLWLGLTARAIAPALRRKDESRPLLVLFTLSSVAIAAFYGAGLMYGQHSHLAMVEYWRWWVVHLWVEGFFEVFATVVMAFLFVRMGLMRAKVAVPTVLFSTAIFLAGGILGTFHHLYFSGTPSAVLGLGATFSALEVVPLVLVGREVWSQIRLTREKGWLQGYRWPILFFVAVAFWNLVGAGVFGFLINPPIALYYMQGLNLTPLHGHTALFGVYGMLGIGLTLFCFRMARPHLVWKTRLLKWSFVCLNAGLSLMALLSLLPVGLLQTQAAIAKGTWWARSPALLDSPLFQTLKWLRVPGDILFAVGGVLLAWWTLGLLTGGSVEQAPVTEGTVRELPKRTRTAGIAAAVAREG